MCVCVAQQQQRKTQQKIKKKIPCSTTAAAAVSGERDQPNKQMEKKQTYNSS